MTSWDCAWHCEFDVSFSFEVFCTLSTNYLSLDSLISVQLLLLSSVGVVSVQVFFLWFDKIVPPVRELRKSWY